MERDPSSPQGNEARPDVGYPRNRFVAMLSVLFVLLLLFAWAQRADVRITKNKSVSEASLQDDLAVKLLYASKGLLPSSATGTSSTARMESAARKKAVAGFRDSVKRNPSTGSLRKLIIVDDPAQRAADIERLNRLSKTPSEPAMWTRIYISDRLSAAQTKAYAARIRGLNLGWYEHLALSDLYTSAGMKSDAARERKIATSAASRTFAFALLLITVLGFLFLAGVVLIIIYLVMGKNGQLKPHSPIDDMSPVERSFVAGYLLETFVLYLLITFGVQTVAGIVIVLIKNTVNASIHANSAYLTAFVYVLAGVLSLAYLRYRLRAAGWSWSVVGLVSRTPLIDVLAGVGTYAAALPLLFIASLLTKSLDRYVHTPDNPIVPEFLEARTLATRVILFALVSIAAPFFEELFFRGALFHSFHAKWGVTTGVLLSAAVFGLVHPLPLSFLPIFALGSVFATAAYNRGSLLPCMVAHGLNNAAATLFLMILSGS